MKAIEFTMLSRQNRQNMNYSKRKSAIKEGERERESFAKLVFSNAVNKTNTIT